MQLADIHVIETFMTLVFMKLIICVNSEI